MSLARFVNAAVKRLRMREHCYLLYAVLLGGQNWPNLIKLCVRKVSSFPFPSFVPFYILSMKVLILFRLNIFQHSCFLVKIFAVN